MSQATSALAKSDVRQSTTPRSCASSSIPQPVEGSVAGRVGYQARMSCCATRPGNGVETTGPPSSILSGLGKSAYPAPSGLQRRKPRGACSTMPGTVARMASSEKRFEVFYEQKSLAEVTRILRDRDTGVCYLQTWSGTSGGLTVLVNSDGSPVVQHS